MMSVGLDFPGWGQYFRLPVDCIMERPLAYQMLHLFSTQLEFLKN